MHTVALLMEYQWNAASKLSSNLLNFCQEFILFARFRFEARLKNLLCDILPHYNSADIDFYLVKIIG